MTRSNKFIWFALLGLTGVTFVLGLSLGEQVHGSAFLSQEGSMYDATGEAPILVPLEMNDDEALALSSGGREALGDFWQHYILELTSRLSGAIREDLDELFSEIRDEPIAMITVTWAYPGSYELTVETVEGKTFPFSREIPLIQPQEDLRRFLIPRVSFAMVFRNQNILSTFEHSLASPAWQEDPDLRREITVETTVEKDPSDGSVLLTFHDPEGETSEVQAKLPLPSSRPGADLTRVQRLLEWFSVTALPRYMINLFGEGRFDRALAGQDRITQMSLTIKNRSQDWEGELIIDLIPVMPIPPPPILQGYFFAF